VWQVVSALAVDPSGARVVTGSHDYDVKLWDFGGMDARFKPFKSWEPAESYHVGASWPSTTFIDIGVGTRSQVHERGRQVFGYFWYKSSQVVRTGRGRSVCAPLALDSGTNAPLCSATFIKGDPYIRDMKNTA
jgi:hypothetical protein